MNSRIPFIRPRLPDAEALAADFASIASANWYTNFGPREQEFRRALASYLGRDLEVVTVSNATVGLMAAVAASLPRGAGTERIATTSFTFAAGAHAVLSHGYVPAWIDIDAETLQPSIASFRLLLQQDPDIRGILLTNTFGIGTPDIIAWEAAAAELGIPLIVDSAAGFGSQYPDGELLGARGTCEVFSFHATKPFAIGEGGAVVTRDASLAARMRGYTNFGFQTRDAGAESAGQNGKLQEINAAIGLRQLEEFDAVLAERRSVFSRYQQRFVGTELRIPAGVEASSVGFAPLVARDCEQRNAILGHAATAAVEVRNYYAPPVHLHPYFTEHRAVVPLDVTVDLASRMLSLPVLRGMTPEEVERVCSVVESGL